MDHRPFRIERYYAPHELTTRHVRATPEPFAVLDPVLAAAI